MRHSPTIRTYDAVLEIGGRRVVLPFDAASEPGVVAIDDILSELMSVQGQRTNRPRGNALRAERSRWQGSRCRPSERRTGSCAAACQPS